MIREIRGGGHSRHAQVRPDADRDHIPRDLFAQAHAGVELAGDDVDQAGFDNQLHLDVGIIRQQPLKRGPEDRLRRVLAGVDADRAGGLVPQLAEPSELGLDLVESRAQGLDQALARLRGRDAAGGAGQEPQSETGLEPANGVAQGRLRRAESGRGPGEAALLGDGQERHQVAKLVPAHS